MGRWVGGWQDGMECGWVGWSVFFCLIRFFTSTQQSFSYAGRDGMECGWVVG